MNLSAAHKATLRAHILGTPELLGTVQNKDQAFVVEDWANRPAVPTVWVWDDTVSVPEVEKVFVWAEWENISETKQAVWRDMTRHGTIDASDARVRDGIAVAFATAPQTYAAVIAACSVPATNAEALIAAGGTGVKSAPRTVDMGRGKLTADEIVAPDFMGW